jgi:ribosomal protein L29
MPAPRKYPLELRERAVRMYRAELAALRKEYVQLRWSNEVRERLSRQRCHA